MVQPEEFQTEDVRTKTNNPRITQYKDHKRVIDTLRQASSPSSTLKELQMLRRLRAYVSGIASPHRVLYTPRALHDDVIRVSNGVFAWLSAESFTVPATFAVLRT